MKLDWLWTACFYDEKKIAEDGNDRNAYTYIKQPPDDRYSKHDDSADWNPSSYRDFLEYFKDHKEELIYFMLKKVGSREIVRVMFDDDRPTILKEKEDYSYEAITSPYRLTDAQPIYYREMENKSVNGVFGEPRVVAYVIGYQGQDKDGKNYRKMVRVLA